MDGHTNGTLVIVYDTKGPPLNYKLDFSWRRTNNVDYVACAWSTYTSSN